MAEPLTTDEAKTHLRILHASEDEYVASLVLAARLDVESDTWRAIVRAQRTLILDGFPPGDRPIYLPNPPLVSVDEIGYLDENGDEQELDLFRVADSREPAEIWPAYGLNWPGTRDDPAAVVITYTAGYADGEVPEHLRQCIRLKLAELYEGRIPGVAEKRTGLDRMLEKIRFRDSRIAPFMLGQSC